MRFRHRSKAASFDGDLTASELADLQKVCCDEEWLGITILIHCMACAAGHEARWLAGCPCHTDKNPLIKANTRAGVARRRVRGIRARDEHRAAPCCWKGKRGPLLALGAGDAMCGRLRQATSAAHKELMLRASAAVSQTLRGFEQRVKDKMISTISAKLAYHKQLPHKLLGGFGHCMGAELADSKRAIKECISEFDAVLNKNSLHRVAIYLLAHGTSERAQLAAFASEDGGELIDYPLIFVALQELAASGCDEVYVEAEHSRINRALAPTGYLKPATICAMLRRKYMVHLWQSDEACQELNFPRCVCQSSENPLDSRPDPGTWCRSGYGSGRVGVYTGA